MVNKVFQLVAKSKCEILLLTADVNFQNVCTLMSLYLCWTMALVSRRLCVNQHVSSKAISNIHFKHKRLHDIQQALVLFLSKQVYWHRSYVSLGRDCWESNQKESAVSLCDWWFMHMAYASNPGSWLLSSRSFTTKISKHICFNSLRYNLRREKVSGGK